MVEIVPKYSLSVHLQIEINKYDDSIPEIGLSQLTWKTLSWNLHCWISNLKDK